MKFSCIAKDGVDIDARACVERQLGERCHCPKAVYAINAYAETYDRTSLKQREDLDVMRARACGFYKKPAVEQYAGPALEAQRAKEIPQEAMKPEAGTAPPVEPIEVPTPGSPAGSEIREEVIAQAPRVCQFAGCGRHLRVDNESGYCRAHRQSHQIEGACLVEGCGKKAHGRGMCFTHYQRDLRQRKESNVVSIKDVSVKEVARSAGFDLDGAQPGKVVLDETLPDVRTLPHEYLVACCKEARRRVEEMDVLFTFTTQATGSAR